MTVIEAKSKGELPINWRLTSFPADARRVLKIRAVVSKYLVQNNLESPIADLVAEQALLDKSPVFGKLYRSVNQPVTFALPTRLLKVLSRLP